MASLPSAQQVTLNSSGVRRQLPIDYSAADVSNLQTNGLSCNVAGTVVFKDGVGNTVTRGMLAGVDYCWEVTAVIKAGTTVGMGLYGLYST